MACEPLAGANGKLPGAKPGQSGSPLKTATLGPLVTAAPQLGVSIPAGLTEDLVKERNAAAHGGEVTADRARDLLDVVVELRSLLVSGWVDEVERASAASGPCG